MADKQAVLLNLGDTINEISNRAQSAADLPGTSDPNTTLKWADALLKVAEAYGLVQGTVTTVAFKTAPATSPTLESEKADGAVRLSVDLLKRLVVDPTTQLPPVGTVICNEVGSSNTCCRHVGNGEWHCKQV